VTGLVFKPFQEVEEDLAIIKDAPASQSYARVGYAEVHFLFDVGEQDLLGQSTTPFLCARAHKVASCGAFGEFHQDTPWRFCFAGCNLSVFMSTAWHRVSRTRMASSWRLATRCSDVSDGDAVFKGMT
jgi:hypothetical protein